jgi:hypothetical protein
MRKPVKTPLKCSAKIRCRTNLKYYTTQLGISRPYAEKSIWKQAQIVRAQELNLGSRLENIRVSSDGVAEIDGMLAKWN